MRWLTLAAITMVAACTDANQQAEESLQLGDYARAREILEAEARESPRDVETRRLLLRVYRHQADDQRAAETAGVIANLTERSRDIFLAASLAARAGRLETSRELLRPWTDEVIGDSIEHIGERSRVGVAPDTAGGVRLSEDEQREVNRRLYDARQEALAEFGLPSLMLARSALTMEGRGDPDLSDVAEVVGYLEEAAAMDSTTLDGMGETIRTWVEAVPEPQRPYGSRRSALLARSYLRDLMEHYELRGRLLILADDLPSAEDEFIALELLARADTANDEFSRMLRFMPFRFRLDIWYERGDTERILDLCEDLEEEFPAAFSDHPPPVCVVTRERVSDGG